ncbi:MAG: universal stress protein [Gammaproteobacteria bacterium]|nr:universal stress protein [Gammaproteobacteria bacterium]MCD8543283.1 universal stress protein [Gammaproteobacteria bacterium]
MSVYQHLLIATDLSDENQIVIEQGLAIANAFGSAVSLLHVVEPLPGYGYAYVGIADIEVELREEALKKIHRLAEKYSIPQDRCHVTVGPIKVELKDVIKNNSIDCLVLGSHGRHGLSELLGSTAHAAVHSAPCDVMTVRIKGKI